METAKATEIKPETETVEIKHWSGRVLFSARDIGGRPREAVFSHAIKFARKIVRSAFPVIPISTRRLN